MENYTFRLKSAQDLFDSNASFAHEKGIEAGCVMIGMGRQSADTSFQAAKCIQPQRLCLQHSLI